MSINLKAGYASQVKEWVKLFDPKTSDRDQSVIFGAFRKFVEGHKMSARHTQLLNLPIDYSEVGKDSIVGIVMAGALDMGAQLFANLRAEGISTKFFLAGYSSGKYSQHAFSNGEPLKGKLFIPKEHLNMLQENPNSPLLLVDNVIVRGITLAAIGQALKERIKHRGSLYQLYTDVSCSPFEIKPWTGKIYRDFPYVESSLRVETPPVLTEGCREFSVLQRA